MNSSSTLTGEEFPKLWTVNVGTAIEEVNKRQGVDVERHDADVYPKNEGRRKENQKGMESHTSKDTEWNQKPGRRNTKCCISTQSTTGYGKNLRMRIP